MTCAEKLKKITEEYNIGKKPLAKLLGWGEVTVLRYMQGGTPDAAFMSLIDKICNNPVSYLRILEKEKAKITDVAYRKSRKAVVNLIFLNRIFFFSQYILKCTNGDIGPSYIMATLFYAQMYSIYERKSTLFDNGVSLEKTGWNIYPVLNELLSESGLIYDDTVENTILDEEKKIISDTIGILNGFAPNALKALIRRERYAFRKLADGSTYVENSRLMLYYEKAFKKVEMKDISDLKNYILNRLK